MHNIYGDYMKLLKYYLNILIIICIITMFCFLSNFLICLNIRTFKIAVHSMTKSYIIFKAIFPIIYIMLGINLLNFSLSYNSRNNIYIATVIYLIQILTTILTSILTLRIANFIFSFWLSIFSLIVSIIFYYFYTKNTRYKVPGIMLITCISYLCITMFYLYSMS